MLVANPFYYVVRAYRKLLLGSTAPSLHDLAIVTVYGAVRVRAGRPVFPAHEARLRGRAYKWGSGIRDWGTGGEALRVVEAAPGTCRLSGL